MCGIIGYFSKSERTPARAALERAMDAMTHRGPDGRGIWTEGRAGLGFRRLSVIDLKTGDQPMTNEDGTLYLVFNGEIYNFRELRESLEKRGHRFKTKSDTETILHLYEEEGEQCVERLRGMFAFAIHDRNKNTFFLARDRFGKKPLVYSETSSGFYFASEIGALLQLADCSRTVDFAAVDAYLSLNYVPGAHTAWRDITRLPAASTLWVRNGIANKSQRYWQLDWKQSSVTHLSEDEGLDGFRERFEESVKLRMIADVPLGAFLSGGVDSSVTTAAMTRLGGKVKTFCIGFEDPRFDESPYAREIAHRLDTDHHELRVEADSLDALDGLIDNLGEPFADQSLLPTFLLSRFTRQHVTVALSGDGGDEFFAGYKRYRHLAQAGFLKRWGLVGPWLTASRALFRIEQQLNPSRWKLEWPRSSVDRILGLEPLEQYLQLVGCWNQEARSHLWRKKMSGDHPSPPFPGWLRPEQGDPAHDLAMSFVAHAVAGHPDLRGSSQWQAMDVETYLIDDILRKVDTASMACSLECRCPLLDQRVTEFAAGLPGHFKTNRRGQTKIMLKKLYPDLLPSQLFEREKKGFSMPIGKWMRNQWKEIIRSSIEDAWDKGMETCFDRESLRQIWREHLDGRQDHGSRLWAWLVLFRWDQRFKPDWKA